MFQLLDIFTSCMTRTAFIVLLNRMFRIYIWGDQRQRLSEVRGASLINSLIYNKLPSFPQNLFLKSSNIFLFAFGHDRTCSPPSSLPRLFIHLISLQFQRRSFVHPGMVQELPHSTSTLLSTQKHSAYSYYALYARTPPYSA